MRSFSPQFRRDLRVAVSNALLLVVLLPLLAFGRATETTSLYEAIRDGKVDVTFSGTGGSSGDAVLATVKKPQAGGSNPLDLTVQPGSILHSGNPGAQNMVIMGVRGRDVGGGRFAPASRISASRVPATYVLSAFCAEFEKDNPSTSDTFTLGAPDPVLACIAKQGQALSVPAKQAAVWMHTDQMTYERINHKFAVTPADWAAAEAVYQRCQAVASGLKDDRSPGPVRPIPVQQAPPKAGPSPPAQADQQPGATMTIRVITDRGDYTLTNAQVLILSNWCADNFGNCVLLQRKFQTFEGLYVKDGVIPPAGIDLPTVLVQWSALKEIEVLDWAVHDKAQSNTTAPNSFAKARITMTDGVSREVFLYGLSWGGPAPLAEGDIKIVGKLFLAGATRDVEIVRDIRRILILRAR